MNEGAARAVLREAWLRGQRCVELQRDGKRTIFVCTRCGTRCYSDAALVDHLQGNMHTRLSVAWTAEKDYGSRDSGEERAIAARGAEERSGSEGDGSSTHRECVPGEAEVVVAHPPNFAGLLKTPLAWIGSVELFFRVRSGGASPVVDSSWFNWKGKGLGSSCHGRQGSGIAYAVVKFPYSDMIGRGGDSKQWLAESKPSRTHGMQAEERLLVALSCTNSQPTAVRVNPGGRYGHQASAVPYSNSPPSVESVVDKNGLQVQLEKRKHCVGASSRLLRRVCKRNKAKVAERLCFICHQRMSSGNDVAALLNLQTKQLVCGSRNKRGVFHVYHSSCLMDWIATCELKTFTGQVDRRIDHTRKLTRTRRAIVEQSRNGLIQGDGGLLPNTVSEGAIFCPECQGTGLNVRGAQLERPRYRLAQVFDWILELIQARKAWTDKPTKPDTSNCGLLFCDHPQVDSGTVQSRGLVHCYSGCVDILAGNALERDFGFLDMMIPWGRKKSVCPGKKWDLQIN